MTIYMTARFEVKKEALEICKQTIQEFVNDVRENEPDTLLYTSLQEKTTPHVFSITLSFAMKRRASFIPTQTR